MNKNTFWNDAARTGAVMALVHILSAVAGLYWKSPLLTLLSVAVLVTLLYLFVRDRARRQGSEGYGFGACMKYIFWMMVFAGILYGAWEIVARNVLFTERYEQTLAESLSIVAKSLPAAQLDDAAALSRKVLFAPLWIVVQCIFGCVIQGVFFGLFVSAFARREPDVFADDDDTSDPSSDERRE